MFMSLNPLFADWIRRGKTATVAALVDMGCKVTALTYPANFTALHYAAMRGFKGTVLCLLRKGADVRALSKFGDDAAEMARDCEQVRIAKNPRHMFRTGKNPVHVLCECTQE
jgi:ankyrin repeat protein